MEDTPPINPRTHKLTPASVGITDKDAYARAMKLYKKLITDIAAIPRDPRPTYSQVRAVIDRYPPEVRAILLMKQLSNFADVLVAWREWAHQLVTIMPEAEEAQMRQLMAQAFEDMLTPVRVVGRQIVDQTRQRAAEGWPEWDVTAPPTLSPATKPVDPMAGVWDFLTQVLEKGGTD